MSILAPTTVDGVIDALSAAPDALMIAGGTDVMVEINAGHRRPTSVIMLNRVAELRSWTVDSAAATVRIGAGVTYAEMMTEPLATLLPALAEAARTVGSPQIRSAGTLGGNLGTCSPAGDGLPVLAALDAIVHLAGPHGERSMPVAEFMVGVKRTARQPDEVITAITLPIVTGWQGYTKVGVRNAMVIALATACLVADDETQRIRLAIGSVAPTIVRCSAAEAHAAAHADIAARRIDDDAVREFGRLAAEASRPIDDHRATAAYRRHAIGVLSMRLLRRALPNG